MKKYLVKIILFFIAIAVVDVLFGKACQYMNNHSKGGGVKGRYYVCKESNEDVLIFGSSRAKHHYVPDIIEDSLKLTCYNTGEEGNGIILCYGFLKMITNRYTPKLIIYDVTDVFDLWESDNAKFLDLLKPYYYEPGIDSIFWSVKPQTRFMMLSELYRFNTTCVRIFGNFIKPVSNTSKGYSPLHKTMDYEPEIKDEQGKIDSVKVEYFKKFIILAKSQKIPLICFVSPVYKAPTDGAKFAYIINLCEKYDIPFYYYAADINISNNQYYFKDRVHLNDKGARFYTTKILPLIKTQISNTGNEMSESK